MPLPHCVKMAATAPNTVPIAMAIFQCKKLEENMIRSLRPSPALLSEKKLLFQKHALDSYLYLITTLTLKKAENVCELSRTRIVKISLEH